MTQRARFAASLFGGLVAACCAAGPSPAPSPATAAPPRAEAHESSARLAAFPGRSLPVPTRREAVVERWFGRDVLDPYRWLEDDDSEDVKRWAEKQNALTRRVLDRVRDRDRIGRRLTELLSARSVGLPIGRRGPTGRTRYFYTKTGGEIRGKETDIALYVRDGLHGQEQVLVDPNVLAGDARILAGFSPSPEGKLVAYVLSREGKDEGTLKVRDVEKGEDLPDTIERARGASIAWTPEGGAFFYARRPAADAAAMAAGPPPPGIFLHRVGDLTARDTRAFSAGPETSAWPELDVSPDGRWLILKLARPLGTDLLLIDLRDGSRARPIPVLSATGATFEAFIRSGVLYLRTNDGAPRYKLYAVDPRRPARARWREVLPEQDEILEGVALAGGELVARYTARGSSRLRRFSLSGQPRGDVELSAIGWSSGLSARPDGDEVFYDFSSFAAPEAVHRLDLASGVPEVWEAAPVPVEPAGFEIERLYAPTKRGSQVPLFVAHKRGLVKDGRTPTVLWPAVLSTTGLAPFAVEGYGRLGEVGTLLHRVGRVVLERGGILAVMDIEDAAWRGEARPAAERDREDARDALVAAASELVALRYTDPTRLAVVGSARGGLFVGALYTERPALVRAAVCRAPLFDLLRSERSGPYGSSAHDGPAGDPWAFEQLLARSPYHHVKPGTQYPALLLTTSANERFVEPLHARKMAAAMQAATASEHPVLLRVEGRSGGGLRGARDRLIDELTDVYAFLFAELDIAPPAP